MERPKGDLREVKDVALNCHPSPRSEASQAEALGACLGVDRPHCTSFQASMNIEDSYSPVAWCLLDAELQHRGGVGVPRGPR